MDKHGIQFPCFREEVGGIIVAGFADALRLHPPLLEHLLVVVAKGEAVEPGVEAGGHPYGLDEILGLDLRGWGDNGIRCCDRGDSELDGALGSFDHLFDLICSPDGPLCLLVIDSIGHGIIHLGQGLRLGIIVISSSKLDALCTCLGSKSMRSAGHAEEHAVRVRVGGRGAQGGCREMHRPPPGLDKVLRFKLEGGGPWLLGN